MWTPNRRVAAATIVASLLGLGLAVGAGGATAGTCNDEAFGVGPGQDLRVTLLDAGPVGIFAGVDNDLNESGDGFNTVTACVGAPDDPEPHQLLAVSASDPTDSPGTMVVSAQQCDTNDATCPYLVGPTGKETAVPTAWYTPPENHLGEGTGAGVEMPEGNCIWIRGSQNCWAEATVASATVGGYDGPSYGLEPECVIVDGECKAHLVSGASLQTGLGSDDWITVVVADEETVPVDLPHHCVSFNHDC